MRPANLLFSLQNPVSIHNEALVVFAFVFGHGAGQRSHEASKVGTADLVTTLRLKCSSINTNVEINSVLFWIRFYSN
jgi:hypothetical protein